MAVKVIDASALGALVFAEPEADEIAQAMADAKLIAPSLLLYELASVCLKKINRSPEQASLLKTAFHMAGRLAVETVAVEMGAVIDLARATNLTTYDACYLWLAETSGAELVTLDKQLLEAYRRR
jgi:predicted nucleic acid-binding protein